MTQGPTLAGLLRSRCARPELVSVACGGIAELTGMQQRIERHDLAAADAGTRRDELVAEQQFREVMSQDQRMLESTWRIQASRQDLARALEQVAAEPEPEVTSLGVDLERDYHERTMECGIDIDRGGPKPRPVSPARVWGRACR